MAGLRASRSGPGRAGCCALAALATSGLLSPAVEGQCQYEITAVIQSPPCPPPLGPGPLYAQAINSHGHVTGYYCNCVTLRDEGFVWTPGTGLVTLTRPPGVVEMMPEDINDAGVICGTWVNSNVPGADRGFVYWPDTKTYSELDTLSGDGSSKAHAISNNNIVVGERATTDKPVPTVAFVWTREGGFIDITPTNEWAIASAISDDGTVVGTIYTTANSFTWVSGTLQLHGKANGSTYTELDAVADNGDLPIIGTAFFGTSPRPVRWDGFFEYLPLLPKHNRGAAITVRSEPLQILGYSRRFQQNPPINEIVPVTWTSDSIYDLNQYTIGSPATITFPVDINSVGQVLARTSDNRGLVLSPTNIRLADLTGDCRTNEQDLYLLLSEWNLPDSSADLNVSGNVNVFDLFILLDDWTG